MRSSPWRAVGLALLASLSGLVLVLRARAEQPRREAEQRGLRLRMERAVWLHEATDHGDTARLPTLPGSPPEGSRRLAVEVSIFNPRALPLEFSPGELRLSEGRTATEWRAVTDVSRPFTLGPGELLFLTLGFDVPRTPAPLRLLWARGEERTALLATRRPLGAEAREPRGWPESVGELPSGSAGAGAALYDRLGCVACHGALEASDAARVGPSLGAFFQAGSTRIAGLSAAQYAYESLLNPDAFIAPACPGGRPCVAPSPMPLYGEVLSAQDMADVIAYLVTPRTDE
ncbi:c-type cytochrome [Melittangium boletus]|uniref:c-type cytochrome n=1 Tax=Melittangium boletus TaxID=83453 RepID=UPI003DA48ADE